MSWNWNETSIKLPYTYENLRTLLNTVCRKEYRFSQFDFVKWCDNLTMAFDEDDREELNELDSLAFGIARDIECQWDLFLVNSFTLEELQNEDLSKVKIPQEWFIQWLEQLNER